MYFGRLLLHTVTNTRYRDSRTCKVENGYLEFGL